MAQTPIKFGLGPVKDWFLNAIVTVDQAAGAEAEELPADFCEKADDTIASTSNTTKEEV